MRGQLGKVSTGVTLLLIGLCWVWLISYGPFAAVTQYAKQGYQDAKAWFVTTPAPKTPTVENTPNTLDADTCANHLPNHGEVEHHRPDSGAQIQGAAYLVNTLKQLVRVQFLDITNHADDVFLYPQQSALVKLPQGEYRVEAELGTSWCNFEEGFLDGEIVATLDNLSLNSEKAVTLKLSSLDGSPQAVMLSVSQSMGNVNAHQASAIEGRGELVLHRGQFGHYFIDGTINRVPAKFMVDTGASFVAVSERFARSAGITECQPAKSSTANGIVTVCLATAQELTIGPFKLTNVIVDYSQGMSEDAFLLGMTVLEQFKVVQQGDVMTLRR